MSPTAATQLTGLPHEASAKTLTLNEQKMVSHPVCHGGRMLALDLLDRMQILTLGWPRRQSVLPLAGTKHRRGKIRDVFGREIS